MNLNVIAIVKKLPIFITLALLSVGGAGFFLFKKNPQKEMRNFELLKEEGYFIPLKIFGYSQSNLPFIEVDIENRTIPSLIDLGFQGMFSLPCPLLNNIGEKKWVKRNRSFGIKGRTYENDVYEVENIKIGNMSFPSVQIKEKCFDSMNEGVVAGTPRIEHHYGSIGWELFTKYNLLVDCRQSVLALCDSLETLKQHQYPVEAFTETPMISSDFLFIEGVTEEGPLYFLLDTGSTWNILNRDLESEDEFVYNEDDIQELSSFKIEGKEFGPITFRRIKSPIKFDAILGMEFFDSHLVFIDFDNKKIHIAPYPKNTWEKPNLRPSIGPMRLHRL